jgi:hypothetical protein
MGAWHQAWLADRPSAVTNFAFVLIWLKSEMTVLSKSSSDLTDRLAIQLESQ